MWTTIKEKAAEFIGNTVISIALRVLVSALLLIIGFKIINSVIKHISKKKIAKDIDKTAKSFIISFASVVLKVLLVLTAAAIVGVPMTSIITVLGSAALAVGLALQGGLSNLAGGVIILFSKPFAVGDYISIDSVSDSEAIEGTVTEIGVMYTQLVTWDNKKIIVPNSKVTGAVVIDHTSFPTRRLDMVYSVAYSADIDKVKDVLLEIARTHLLILKDPEPLVTVEAHGESSLKIKIRWWVKTEDYWTVYFEINELVKKAFDQNGITIPFPQLDVHFDKIMKEDENENIRHHQ